MFKASESLETHLRDAMAKAATELPLQGEGRSNSLRLTSPGSASRRGAGGPHTRRVATPVFAAVATLAVAGTATAATVAVLRDDTAKEFTTLHPDKASVSATAEEPHDLVGTVTIGPNLKARLYVTTGQGAGRCGLVQNLDAANSEIDSVGFCGGTGVAWANVVNGALVGMVPDQTTSVRLAMDGVVSETPVVHGMFITVPPGAGVTDTQLVGYRGSSRIGAWTVSLGAGQ
jgi:hypothetical protein